jgi:hypothetical protein
MAEIEASREARWRQESPAAPAALPVPARPLRLGVIAGATAAAAVLALAGWWVAHRLGNEGRPAAALAECRDALVHAAQVGALTARAETAERALAATRAELERVAAEKTRLEALPAPIAAPADAPPKPASVRKPERSRTIARPSAARTAPAARTKAKKAMNQTDRRLSSVIEAL